VVQKYCKGRLDDIKENTGRMDMYADCALHSEDISKTAEEDGIKIHLTNRKTNVIRHKQI